ncbi:DgyrCDS9662 [Dimorphilus gyrociliatus]|uniref:carbonic anhydrase n=1 Tax=Dimorphilus gyrociliatus TaxID=2664684 RepID=A0A7I8VZ14_9ANNE|nr:DgyrCDS9662 [Dimorphilus gyrociliatus]
MKTLLFIACITFLSPSVNGAAEGNWKYGEEENWPGKCTNGTRQSPIDIITAKAEKSPEWKNFTLTNFDKDLKSREFKHTGKTILLDLEGSGLSIENGGLNGTYQALQLHFHWANDSKSGAEHTIDGKEFPLELHIVTKNGDQEYGQQHAVLGFVFKVVDKNNTKFDSIAAEVPKIKAEDAKINIDVNIKSFLPSNMKVFYRYYGSLTTPNCDEDVIWSVFETPIEISQYQLSIFQDIHFSHGYANYRSIQKLNNRKVLKFEAKPGETSSASCLLYSSFSLIILLFATYML